MIEEGVCPFPIFLKWCLPPADCPHQGLCQDAPLAIRVSRCPTQVPFCWCWLDLVPMSRPQLPHLSVLSSDLSRESCSLMEDSLQNSGLIQKHEVLHFLIYVWVAFFVMSSSARLGNRRTHTVDIQMGKLTGWLSHFCFFASASSISLLETETSFPACLSIPVWVVWHPFLEKECGSIWEFSWVFPLRCQDGLIIM